MIRDRDTVVLTRDLSEHGLRRGDVGAVVHASDTGGYEVEFVTGTGATVAIVTLDASAIRPLAESDLLHVRSAKGG